MKGFADWYRDHQGEQLDVLINNAGIHLDLRPLKNDEALKAMLGFELPFTPEDPLIVERRNPVDP